MQTACGLAHLGKIVYVTRDDHPQVTLRAVLCHLLAGEHVRGCSEKSSVNASFRAAQTAKRPGSLPLNVGQILLPKVWRNCRRTLSYQRCLTQISVPSFLRPGPGSFSTSAWTFRSPSAWFASADPPFRVS